MAVQERVLDPADLQRATPKGTAQQLLELSNLKGIIPVPVEAIALMLGYRVFGFEPAKDDAQLQDIAGLVKYDTKEIWVRTSDSPERQRFTIAHEIGHIAMKHQEGGVSIDFRSTFDGTPTEQKEIDANKFAAELLMPAEDFIRAFFKCLTDEQLALRFGVSQQAVTIRKKVLRIHKA